MTERKVYRLEQNLCSLDVFLVMSRFRVLMWADNSVAVAGRTAPGTVTLSEPVDVRVSLVA